MEREIDYLFLEHLVPVIDDIDHPIFIEELKENIDAAAHEEVYTKLISYHQLRKKDRNDKTKYWLTSKNKESHLVYLFYTIEFTADKIENDKIFYHHY